MLLHVLTSKSTFSFILKINAKKICKSVLVHEAKNSKYIMVQLKTIVFGGIGMCKHTCVCQETDYTYLYMHVAVWTQNISERVYKVTARLSL